MQSNPFIKQEVIKEQEVQIEMVEDKRILQLPNTIVPGNTAHCQRKSEALSISEVKKKSLPCYESASQSMRLLQEDGNLEITVASASQIGTITRPDVKEKGAQRKTYRSTNSKIDANVMLAIDSESASGNEGFEEYRLHSKEGKHDSRREELGEMKLKGTNPGVMQNPFTVKDPLSAPVKENSLNSPHFGLSASDNSENQTSTTPEPSVQSALQNFMSTSPNTQEQHRIQSTPLAVMGIPLEATEWTQGGVVVQPEAGRVPVEARSTPVMTQVEESDTPVKSKHQTFEAIEMTVTPLDTRSKVSAPRVVNATDSISLRQRKRSRRLSRRERKRYSNSLNSTRNSSTESDRATCTKSRTKQQPPKHMPKRNESPKKQRRKRRVHQQQRSINLDVSRQAVERYLYHIPSDQSRVLVGSAGLFPTVDFMPPITISEPDTNHSEAASILMMEKYPFSRCSPQAQERCVLGTFPPRRPPNLSPRHCPHQEQSLAERGVCNQHSSMVRVIHNSTPYVKCLIAMYSIIYNTLYISLNSYISV